MNLPRHVFGVAAFNTYQALPSNVQLWVASVFPCLVAEKQEGGARYVGDDFVGCAVYEVVNEEDNVSVKFVIKPMKNTPVIINIQHPYKTHKSSTYTPPIS